MTRFIVCKKCGNVAGVLNDTGVPMICCGEEMHELVPNTFDASHDKHLPVVEVNGNTVTASVGKDIHPMIEKHYITWVYLQTEKGGQRRILKPDEEPKAVFEVAEGDKPVAVYEYCNLHGLWKTEL